MESHHGKIVAGPRLAFGSQQKAPFHRLSNFWECGVDFENRHFPSSEHAFQYVRTRGEERRKEYTSEGGFGRWTGFGLFHKVPALAAKKEEYWKKKRNIGILAKLAINRTKEEHKVAMTSEEAHDAFYRILWAKFTQNEDLKCVLLDTGDAYLFEFDKSATRLDQAIPPRRVRWGAQVVDNVVVGDNQMGALLMEIRRDLAKSV